MPSLRLLTCVEGALETRLVELIRPLPEIEVFRRCADLADVLAAAAAGSGQVALLSSTLPGLDRVMTADLRRRGIALLGVYDSAGAEQDQALARFAAAGVDTTHRVGDAAALQAAIRDCTGRTMEPEVSEPVVSSEELWRELDPPVEAAGTVVAVWGPVGAPGRSTVAVTLAARLARGGRRVLLVDADTYGASLAQLLGVVEETPGLPAACRMAHAGTLTPAALAELAPQVIPGLQLLTGVPAADRWAEVTEVGLEHLLDQARRAAEVTVVDTGFCLEAGDADVFGPRRNGATLAALAHADAVVAVGAGDPVGLSRLVRGSAALSEVTPSPVVTVVNRMRRAVTGAGANDQVGQILGDLTDRFVTVADDPTATAALATDGAEALVGPGRGPLAEGVGQVATHLVDLGVVRGRGGSALNRRRWWRGRGSRRAVPGAPGVVDSVP